MESPVQPVWVWNRLWLRLVLFLESRRNQPTSIEVLMEAAPALSARQVLHLFRVLSCVESHLSTPLRSVAPPVCLACWSDPKTQLSLLFDRPRDTASPCTEFRQSRSRRLARPAFIPCTGRMVVGGREETPSLAPAISSVTTHDDMSVDTIYIHKVDLTGLNI